MSSPNGVLVRNMIQKGGESSERSSFIIHMSLSLINCSCTVLVAWYVVMNHLLMYRNVKELRCFIVYHNDKVQEFLERKNQSFSLLHRESFGTLQVDEENILYFAYLSGYLSQFALCGCISYQAKHEIVLGALRTTSV